MAKPENSGVWPSLKDLSALEQQLPELMRRLQHLVEIESPSDDKAAVDRCVHAAAEMAEELGAKVRRHRRTSNGDVLEARFKPADRRPKPGTLMLLGHLDTVYPLGTLRSMPYRVGNGRIWGPGTLDMKAGVAMALTALDWLLQEDALDRSVLLVLSGDEEIGSHASRELIEQKARECEAVYVLEPAQGPAGAYKTARKGVGEYTLRVTGVAAHAGLDFEKGHSAIQELAYQIEKIREFTNLKRGVTVSTGRIDGGTRNNVVAAEARAEIDVRVPTARDAVRIERQFRALRVRDSGCRLYLEGGLNRPPMERTRGGAALYRRAATLAGKLGFELTEVTSGGGSDGNFTAALGVPTLDGMGAVGEGAHASHESVIVKELIPRTALLAGIIRSGS